MTRETLMTELDLSDDEFDKFHESVKQQMEDYGAESIREMIRFIEYQMTLEIAHSFRH